MADNHTPNVLGTPPSAKQSSSNFRTLWKTGRWKKPVQDLQFVAHDPAADCDRRKSSKLRGIDGKVASPEHDVAALSKRRQQVREAQKRHRNRKAEYVEDLEAKIARLQQLEAACVSEKAILVNENERMRNLLAEHSLESHLDSVNISSAYHPPAADAESDWFGSAAVGIRHDDVVGHDRVFVDLSPGLTNLSSPNTAASSSKATPRGESGSSRVRLQGDAWCALDFILALEWPCRGHIRHEGINPQAAVPVACEDGTWYGTGHALTSTNAVFQGACQHAEVRENSTEWRLPLAHIEKLVQLSSQLPLDDEELTPAQAYAAIERELLEVGADGRLLQPLLARLKASLAGSVRCLGLGAVMPADDFYRCLEQARQAMRGHVAAMGA